MDSADRFLPHRLRDALFALLRVGFVYHEGGGEQEVAAVSMAVSSTLAFPFAVLVYQSGRVLAFGTWQYNHLVSSLV